MKRTVAYIDGYNLYYGILKGTPHKWLDPVRLVKALLRDDHELVSVKYFTSPVKTYPHDGAALDRQKVYAGFVHSSECRDYTGVLPQGCRVDARA